MDEEVGLWPERGLDDAVDCVPDLILIPMRLFSSSSRARYRRSPRPCIAAGYGDADANTPLVVQMTLTTNDGRTNGPILWMIGEDLRIGGVGIGGVPILLGPYTLSFNDPVCAGALTVDVEDPSCTFPVCSVSSTAYTLWPCRRTNLYGSVQICPTGRSLPAVRMLPQLAAPFTWV